MTRKRLVLLLAAVAIVALLVWALRPRPVPVDLAAVERRDLTVTLDEEGETRVRSRYEVSAPVAGRVLRIELQPGDPVVAGETVLATFAPADPVPLDLRSRAEGEAAVRGARAGVGQAEARLGQTRAELTFAETELGRRRTLVAQGIESRERLDAAETEVESRRKAVEAARFAEAAARHQLEMTRAALFQDASGGGSGGRAVLTLRSPVRGVVLERARESEAVVGAGEPLLTVGDPSDLEVVADFLSTDAVRIAPGQPALVEDWGEPEPLRAVVRRVEPRGFTKVSALGVEEQRVDVVLDLVDPGERSSRLGDGYRVQVRVVVFQGDDVLTVPTSSLFRRGGAWEVFVAEDGVARRRQIEIGHRNPVHAQVTAGLEEGARVVAYPGDEVEDGAKIAPR